MLLSHHPNTNLTTGRNRVLAPLRQGTSTKRLNIVDGGHDAPSKLNLILGVDFLEASDSATRQGNRLENAQTLMRS